MFQDLTVKKFTDILASNEPMPGGGSVAALSGALSVSLLEMVTNLTIGKKKYAEAQEEMKEIKKIAENMKSKFLNDITRDSNSYKEVDDAFGLPKTTDEEKKKRKEAIQEGLKSAAKVPLEIAKDAYKIFDYAEKVVEKGNQSAVTDGLIATMMARNAVIGAMYNVKINLLSIKDEEFVKEYEKEMEKLSDVNEREQKILAKSDIKVV
ncbi:cyclodeaminase/cyclohydrolase family protein [Senegalia massiliensis]|uniref:Methenyltetrahydrofolate cyclohydrolase n=1 Tax=Senegalia massiliensis TaxID=1720316 RepID=A0A845R2P1_9CLOT|nr:cyclodeaminase/cyclohydrolase family protein [Senegalia massiliensis]NBI07838.1 methenyltetrahydrofolate cyclohydrolase [Senegalia massiliensis]